MNEDKKLDCCPICNMTSDQSWMKKVGSWVVCSKHNCGIKTVRFSGSNRCRHCAKEIQMGESALMTKYKNRWIFLHASPDICNSKRQGKTKIKSNGIDQLYLTHDAPDHLVDTVYHALTDYYTPSDGRYLEIHKRIDHAYKNIIDIRKRD